MNNTVLNQKVVKCSDDRLGVDSTNVVNALCGLSKSANKCLSTKTLVLKCLSK